MSANAESTVTTHDDGRFVRTAIVIPEKGTTFDLVDELGERLAVINAFVYDKSSHIIVDVIDIDDRFGDNKVLAFQHGFRESIGVNKVASVDFRTPSPVKEGA